MRSGESYDLSSVRQTEVLAKTNGSRLGWQVQVDIICIEVLQGAMQIDKQKQRMGFVKGRDGLLSGMSRIWGKRIIAHIRSACLFWIHLLVIQSVTADSVKWKQVCFNVCVFVCQCMISGCIFGGQTHLNAVDWRGMASCEPTPTLCTWRTRLERSSTAGRTGTCGASDGTRWHTHTHFSVFLLAILKVYDVRIISSEITPTCPTCIFILQMTLLCLTVFFFLFFI